MNLDHIAASDAISYLRTLPDESVNLCITSPPYFGLRDYGTATWEGGDAACDHKIPASTLGGGNNKGHNGSFTANYGATCGKCGAQRIDQQIGLEDTPAAYIARLIDVFAEVKRVLRADGNLYVNLGDSYNSQGGHTSIEADKRTNRAERSKMKGNSVDGLPPKSLLLIPHRFAIAMQDDGWLLREDIVWQKPNPMPESVKDRCTRAHEYIFHFAKQSRYWYDAQAVAEKAVGVGGGGFPGWLKGVQPKHGGTSKYRTAEGRQKDVTRNRRSVWTINTANFRAAHFATFPEAIPQIIITAACPDGGVVLDPFMGAGTVAFVAKRMNRRYLGCDLNPEYVQIAEDRVASIPYPMFSTF